MQVLDSLESNATGGGERPEDQSDDPDKVKYVSRTEAELRAAASASS